MVVGEHATREATSQVLVYLRPPF